MHDEDRPYTSRRTGRTLRFALIAVAVLFAQHAAQLHAFSHFKREITQAKQLADGALPAYPQPQCLVLDAPGDGRYPAHRRARPRARRRQ